ncbi:MAG: diguanylate cyclase [Coriobacteriia bacterium]|nr:diguanylate cyclase [Coriobacteriia bacterium]
MRARRRGTDALVGRFSRLLGLALTGVTVLVFVWIGIRTTGLVERSVLDQARSYTDLIVAARSWNTGHGGVWVKKSADTLTNPYLAELGVEADARLEDGTEITLRNPAAMTREIGDVLVSSATPSRFKLTSLVFVNPGNAPDAWERDSLEQFERGTAERWGVEDADEGTRVFRYMRPLPVEEGCLSCHGDSGYRVGDIRGAISVTLPYGEVAGALRRNGVQLALLASAVLVSLWLVVFGLTRWLTDRLRDARERLEHMATTDGLTGLWNRRFTLESLARELDRARREGASTGVVLVDIDHFKGVNDDYGHAAGDEALRRTADVLSQVVRQYDIVGRVGGEEMLVVAPDVSAGSLGVLAERLRAAVEALDTADVCPDRSLTISVGTALAAAGQAETVDALIARADAAMYAAKDAGRNRVVAG